MIVVKILVAILIVLGLVNHGQGDDAGNFQVGVGISDVTGPCADIGMMGYANPAQVAGGIHIRLFSRAFIFESEGNRVVFVSSDIGMVDQATKTQVVEALQEIYGPDLYTSKNVVLSGTHTHSGPAGFIQYLLYGITSLGFNDMSFQAIKDGIVDSISKAHENLKPAKLFFNKGELDNASINRSPTSYLANPADELELYDSDIEKDMQLLRIDSAEGDPLGVINWFAVHPTSMNNTNRLISGDNKGYASQLFEKEMNPNDRPGHGGFVAAFASANLGDLSPNVEGPRCIDTGLPCHAENSTCCNNFGCFTQLCIAFGPGEDMEESTKIIGERQYNKAKELFDNASQDQITGPVQFIHQYVKMDEYMVEFPDSTKEPTQLCKAGLGFAFAGGTIDGPGMFDFHQGDTDEEHPFWDIVKYWLTPISKEQEECQKPKPVLLSTGEATWPYEWTPSIVETQILRVGNLYIIAIPGELTTMAGRRLRKVVEDSIKEQYPDGPEPKVVIAGLSNVYTHYITTFEEYQKQRYEAASTLYGPHTLQAYLQQYKMLTDSMLQGENIEDGPTPPNLLDEQFTLVPPIAVDMTPGSLKFGDLLTESPATVVKGEEVSVTFVGGHPKNSPMRSGTFLLVERLDEASSSWETYRTDADWDTKFLWSRPSLGSLENHLTIKWKTDSETPDGSYRIRHFGYYKPYGMDPKPYFGETEPFQVVTKRHVKDLKRW